MKPRIRISLTSHVRLAKKEEDSILQVTHGPKHRTREHVFPVVCLRLLSGDAPSARSHRSEIAASTAIMLPFIPLDCRTLEYDHVWCLPWELPTFRAPMEGKRRRQIMLKGEGRVSQVVDCSKFPEG